MTLQEIRDAWLRWIHRRDVAADLDTVEVFATAQVANSLMYRLDVIEPIDDAVARMPNLFLHAGLVYLHELAQDDEGLAREKAMFDAAVTDWHFRRSIDEVDAVMEARHGT